MALRLPSRFYDYASAVLYFHLDFPRLPCGTSQDKGDYGFMVGVDNAFYHSTLRRELPPKCRNAP